MLLLYNLSIRFYGLLISLMAPFNRKAKLFIRGRKDIWGEMSARLTPGASYVWFHFPSLGEFEQGRPVLEAWKLLNPEKKFVVTFFSPSGYEIRKDYPLADAVFYLPLDTASNARRFIGLLKPEAAIFVKYDYWHHYFRALQKNNIPLYMVSAIFRANQIYFKWYGSFYRKILNSVTHFFLQNQESVELLRGLGFENLTLAGDTRFDRVASHARNAKLIPEIELFADGNPVLIAGSTWPPDEKLLAGLLKNEPGWKLVIAPHEINKAHIASIEQLFPGAMRFSAFTREGAQKSNVLIIDNIGMLSSLYQYGQLAYIGGGFGVGIHNTLEAAAFGLPVIYGPNDAKFQEARDLRSINAAIRIEDQSSLNAAFNYFRENLEPAGQAARHYVAEKTGATETILNYMRR